MQAKKWPCTYIGISTRWSLVGIEICRKGKQIEAGSPKTKVKMVRDGVESNDNMYIAVRFGSARIFEEVVRRVLVCFGMRIGLRTIDNSRVSYFLVLILLVSRVAFPCQGCLPLPAVHNLLRTNIVVNKSRMISTPDCSASPSAQLLIGPQHPTSKVKRRRFDNVWAKPKGGTP